MIYITSKNQPRKVSFLTFRINEVPFRLDSRYIYDTLYFSPKNSQEFRESLKVNITYLYPELHWLPSRDNNSRRNRLQENSVILRLSKQAPVRENGNFECIKSKKGVQEVANDIDVASVKKLEYIYDQNKPSVMDVDYYFYNNGVAWMECTPKNRTEYSAYNSCRLKFTYKGIYIDAFFDRTYKADFLSIMQSARDLLASFEVDLNKP
ncbi:MAG: hypothetical protein ACR2PW_01365 [Gammaproteobacteria bacterium]